MLRPILLCLTLALAPLWLWPGEAKAGLQSTTELIEAGFHAGEETDLPPGARLEILLPAEAPDAAARLIAAHYDMEKSAFLVVLETAEGAQIPVRGRIFAVIDLPVPRHAIAAGTVLSAQDFTTRPMYLAGLSRFVVKDLAALTGREVRRPLPEGRPVQSQSLQLPQAVRRGEKVTLNYQKGALALTAPGQALEDAAIGESLRIQNLNSGKTVSAIASGEGQAEVSP